MVTITLAMLSTKAGGGFPFFETKIPLIIRSQYNNVSMLVVKLWSVSGELSYTLMTSAIWRQWQINLTSIYATNKISVGSQRPRFCVYHFIFNHLISNVVIQHQIYSNYSSQKSLFLIWWNSSTQRLTLL